ncbi:MAG: hypothetical protein M3422_08765 [Actinomycetota bacterium]|nr:hypothetical protein [Actinomycetota bacterium]
MSQGAVRRVAVAGLAALALLASGCDDEELPTSAGEPSPKPSSAAEAARFAPMVWLAEGDDNGPMDASRFVAESALFFQGMCVDAVDRHRVASDVDERKLAGHNGVYTTRQCSSAKSEPEVASDSFSGSEETVGFYLDLADDDGLRRGDGPSAPVYWQFYDKGDGHTTAYVYWLFYGYNDFVNKHEGDWERVAVQLKDGEPDGLTFWKHEEGPCRVGWDDVGTSDGHPVTYSAAGSHGSYPWEGSYDATPQGPDPFQPVTDTTSQGTGWPTWEHARSVVEQPWWGYRGRWGAQNAAPGGKGPHGPHPDRQEAVFATAPCAKPLPDPTASPGPSVPQDEPEQGKIPEAFLDTWESREPMARPGLAQPYYVRIQLWGEDFPDGEDGEGVSGYSDDFENLPGEGGLSCSADLDATEISATKVVFAETEDFDTYGNCPDKGTVTLTLVGDTLTYDYSGGGHTVLVRD